MTSIGENPDIDLEKLRGSLNAIENPAAVYKTSFEIQNAAYSSILASLLFLVAIQIANSGVDYVYVLGISIIALVFGVLVTGIRLLRCFLYAMSAESDRRENGILFANSVLLNQSDSALSNYREFNIKNSRTHNSGPYLLHIIVILMSLILFAMQFTIFPYLNLEPSSMHLLFEPISSSSPSTILFLGIVVLVAGLIGCFLRVISDVMVSKWSKIQDSEIPIQAKKLKSNKHLSRFFNMEMTFEDAVELLNDAERGAPCALESALTSSDAIEREYTRFKRIRWLYIIAIAMIAVIDFFLLFD